MRKLLAVLIAVAALAGAAASQRGVSQGHLKAARDAAQIAGDELRQRTQAALRELLRGEEGTARAAAALPQLRGQLALLRNERLEGALAQTLVDWFRDEPEWGPYRRDFPVHGVADGERLGVLSGIAGERLEAAPLVREAGERGVASGLLAGVDELLVVSAARVPVAGRTEPAVLLLGRPLRGRLLADAAAWARTSLLVAQAPGGEPIPGAGQGDAPALERLTAAARSLKDKAPAAAHVYLAPDGSWSAALVPTAPGFALWAYADNAAGAAASAARARTTSLALWGAGALVAILALVFGLRGPAPARAAIPTATSPGRPTPRSPPPVVEAGTPLPEAQPESSLRPPGGPAAGARALAESQTELALTPAAPVRAPRDLRTFGRYHLLDRLGEGGMSQVYTAVAFGAEGFRRRFVVKRLRPELLDDPAVVAQFIDEAKLASTLVHSNIIPVLDFGKVGDEYFLASEYILGRDLGRITQRCQETRSTGASAMPLPAVLFAALEVLKALEYAHTRLDDEGRPLGIVHRDVSPNNVLVSARGEVKLFDFGIVKAEGRVTRTQHGVVKGNVSFMSPEQARGFEVDARADLFSLGLVIYYCLSGELLYQGRTTYELLLKAASGLGLPELDRVNALPGPAADLVARALETDPSARYASAAEFAAALAPHLGGGLGGGAGQLAALMKQRFAGEFAEEEARFASAVPGAQPVVGANPADGNGRGA